LSKPPLSAWAVNQLFWRHRKAFDRLLSTGEKFRDAQAAQLKGRKADLRGTLDARREALSELTRLAADLLREGGHAAGPDTMRRVTTTLEALASYAGVDGAPAAGHLTADVDPPGFEALAALVPNGAAGGHSGGEPRVLQFRATRPPRSRRKLSEEERQRQEQEERRAAKAAAKAALQAAEKTLRDARRDAERAEAALKKAAAAAKEAEKARAEIEARYEKLVAAAESTKTEARRVAVEAEEAAQAVEDAERALEKAQREARSE
jgi:flagellar biosynthesis GTPase FlhF